MGSVDKATTKKNLAVKDVGLLKPLQELLMTIVQPLRSPPTLLGALFFPYFQVCWPPNCQYVLACKQKRMRKGPRRHGRPTKWGEAAGGEVSHLESDKWVWLWSFEGISQLMEWKTMGLKKMGFGRFQKGREGQTKGWRRNNNYQCALKGDRLSLNWFELVKP